MTSISFTPTAVEIEATSFRNRFIESKEWQNTIKLILMGIALVLLVTRLTGPIRTAGITLGTMLAAYGAWHPFALRGVIRRKLQDQPELLRATTILFDEKELTIERANGRVSLRWPELRRFTQTSNCYALHLDSFGAAIILPKRAFAPAQAEEFLRYADTINPAHPRGHPS